MGDVDHDEPPPRPEGEWHDDASDLFGPRSWASIVATEGARCRRYARTATVVVVDVPDLDALAGTWGSDVLEAALGRIARRLRRAARSSDFVARLGARRFAVLLPETDEVAAVNFVERARSVCDAALPREASDRCRFGWADARPPRTLELAAELAVSRLASDA